MTDISDIAKVVCVTPQLIQIEITSSDRYEQLANKLEIGSYLKISTLGGPGVISMVRSYRIKDTTSAIDGADGTHPPEVAFLIDTQPVGILSEGVFKRGGAGITIPPKNVEIASVGVLKEMYAGLESGRAFVWSSLAQNPEVRVVLDGDRFFGKHVAIVGSTGSGKSGTVAKILQEGIRPTSGSAPGVLNNSHILIFDLHDEYRSAFPSANVFGVDALALPYWLMNSEELEDIFIESNEENSHNQISQFRQAVVENKRAHNSIPGSPVLTTYDSPVYFSIHEVLNYLHNLNLEVIYKEGGKPRLSDGTIVERRVDHYFSTRHKFIAPSSAAATRTVNGPFHGDFGKFLMRLEARLSDSRLNFLLNPTKRDGTSYGTADIESLVRLYFGYADRKSNVTILDLSGVPFEALSVVVSLVSRMIFAFNFSYKKSRRSAENDLPVLLVLEEAHNYVPRSEVAKFKSVRRSVERIAKEGRKYGVSLMVVSQRPSEVSETILSQCNNFVIMRLTNPADQNYVRRLLPDALSVVTEALPTLEQREAVIIGDSISIPSIVRIDELVLKPNSNDVKFLREWRRDWQDVDFFGVLSGIQGENPAERPEMPRPVPRIPAARPEVQVDLTSGESMPVDSADGPR